MAVKTYQTKAEWVADMDVQTESTIGLITEDNETVAHGVNLITSEPDEGDIVFYNEDKDVFFMKLDTYKTTPAGWTPIGVVAERIGDKVMIVYKTNTSQKYADVYRYKVRGFVCDGALHDVTLKLHNSAITDTFQYSIEGTGETYDTASEEQLRTFASTFQNFLDVKINGASGFFGGTYHYSCYVDVDNLEADKLTVYLQLDTYAAYQDVHAATGLTFLEAVATELEASTSLYRANGVTSGYAGLNYDRFYAYYSTAGTATASSMVDPVGTDTIYKKSFFDTDPNAERLREYYGSYEKYIEGNMVMFPSLYGSMSAYFRDGKTQTYKIANKTYAVSGDTSNQAFMYPAAHYCATAGAEGVKGLEPGDWWLPSPYEACYIWPKLTYGITTTNRAIADPINRSLYKIGGSAISQTSYYWFISRYNANNARLYNGYNGYVYGTIFYVRHGSVPLTLYTLSNAKSNDLILTSLAQ